MPSERAAVAPPCMSKDHVRQIKSRKDLVKRLVMENVTDNRGRVRRKYPSTSDIARAVNIASHTSVSAETIRRDLLSFGFTSRKRPRGCKRIDGDPVKRVAACRKFLKMGLAYLRKIGFTDEKYFDTNDHGLNSEWCAPGMDPSPMEQDTWAPNVHVWAFIAHGVKFLVRLPKGKQTAESYKRRCLVPLLQYLHKEGIVEADYVLQFDGDRAHTANDVFSYLTSKGVQWLSGWPARSPDLSPIENMWSILQSRVDKHGPSYADELWAFVKQEWDAIPMEVVNNLVESFPGRCKRCVEKNGAPLTTKDPQKSHKKTPVL